ncbi:MAG: hypothetical protein WBP49_03450 [Acidimicrobiia bacterium]
MRVRSPFATEPSFSRSQPAAADATAFSGAAWARTVGVIIAVLWAIVFIAGSIFVIWARTVRGRDIAEA